eukprot:2497213-Amphidinium_carterae.2
MFRLLPTGSQGVPLALTTFSFDQRSVGGKRRTVRENFLPLSVRMICSSDLPCFPAHTPSTNLGSKSA